MISILLHNVLPVIRPFPFRCRLELTNWIALYNVTAPSKAAAGNELGIFESLGDYLSQTDLDLFYLSLAP